MARGILAFVLLALTPVIVSAQAQPNSPVAAGQLAANSAVSSPLTLLQVLDLAHRTNPSLRAVAEHLSAVRAQETTAGLRANPGGIVSSQMVTLAPNNPNGTEFYVAGVQRLFERGNKRQRRLDMARATTELTSFQLEDQQRQMDLLIRQAFSRMLYAQAAIAISRQNLADYQKTVALMKVRLDAGDIDNTDFQRIELQLAGFESDLDNATLTLQQGSIALQTLIGFPAAKDDFAIVGTLDPPPVTVTLDDLRTAALANRPDLKAAKTQVHVNDAALKLAIANGTADPVVEAEYERAGDANSIGGSVNIPLRTFDRNQGEKSRARYELESSRIAVTATQYQVLSDVNSGWAAYLTAQKQSERYRTKYVAEAAHVRDNLEFSYRNGNTTLLDYLSALSDYRQVNLAALNAKLQLLLALEQLSYAAHTEIVP